jgi:hypothetical protein
MPLRRERESPSLFVMAENLRNKNNEKIYYLFRLSVGDTVGM